MLTVSSQHPRLAGYHTRFGVRPWRAHAAFRKLNAPQNGAKWRASQWLENSAQTDVDVALEEAWALWEDRSRIPEWMAWITSVVVMEDDPKLSKWTLSTYQFNRQWEFSWIALNMTPLKFQKIHWRSVPGSSGGSLGALEVQNRGQIRFMKKGPEKCAIKLTISYEVPNLLTPLVESILQKDMDVFAQYAVRERNNTK
ncbi:hypothetical protein KSW81_006863 [Nannochloris sp. 'desiccata']|nr:hypothetical protein KSW81_006863 [Chlorella desiccata (nom. nud.)]